MTDRNSTIDKRRPIRTFGRKGGRALSARQQGLIRDLLPKIRISEGAFGALEPATLFDGASEVWLEIGFGGAEHLIRQAQLHPDIGFLGCEPFTEGIAKALTGIEENALNNIRLHDDDARDIIPGLAAHSISRTFILFPDPWPKARQQKRRLIQPAFLAELRRIMKPGGTLRFATDVRSYADEALQHFLANGAFDWRAERADDWRCAPNDHVTTRYETKNLGDCAPVWFDFEAC